MSAASASSQFGLRRKGLTWVSIGAVVLGAAVVRPERKAGADIWGGDVAVLVQILAQTIQQLSALRSIIRTTSDTASILQDLNAGVKQVLRLADTAHIPLPPQVYAQAKELERATETAGEIYGPMARSAPLLSRTHYRSGIEGLYLSQDAFGYSAFLDRTGERVKGAAVVANQPTATRLTAETLGVVLHAISHSNRLQAKNLEISSSQRIEDSQKESARFESFVNTQSAIESLFRKSGPTDLNSLNGGGL